MAIVEKNLSTIAETLLTIEKNLSTICSNNYISVNLSTTCMVNLNIKSNLSTVCKILSYSFKETYQQDTNIIIPEIYEEPEEDELFRSILPEDTTALSNYSYIKNIESRRQSFKVIITNTTTGNQKTIPGYLISNISLSRGRNRNCEWSITIDNDADRTFVPNNTNSEYYDYIQNAVFSNTEYYDPNNPDDFYQAMVIDYTWQIVSTCNGESWYSPKLILVSVESSSSGDGYQTVFSGTDISKLLMIEDQSLSSEVSTIEKKIYAKEIIQTILTTFNINNYDINMPDGTDNYPIRLYHFQGVCPIDEITKILGAVFCYWYIDGDTFMIKPQNFNRSGYDWEFRDIFNLIDFSYKQSSAELVNSIVAERSQQYSGVEDHDGTEVGLQTINLSYPRMSPIFQLLEYRHIEGIGTSLYPVDYINRSGKYRSAGNIGPWITCQFVVRQKILSTTGLATGTNLVYWKVRITGMTEAEWQSSIPYDPIFSIRIEDIESQKAYGYLPAPQPIENPLIPNSYWLRIYGERYLQEQSRLLKTVTFKVPLFEYIEPGDTVLIRSEYGTVTNNERFFIETIDHDFSSFETTLTGSQYPAIPTYTVTNITNEEE